MSQLQQSTIWDEPLIWDRLEVLAREAPDRAAITFGSAPALSRREVLDAAMAAACGLARRGVGPGDRVVVMVGNRPEYVSTWLACLRLGATLVPLNTGMRGDILRHMLATCDPGVVVVEAPLRAQLYPELAATCPAALCVVVGAGSLGEGEVDWEDVQVGGLVTAHRGEPDAVAVVLFTSGTTGRSKGVEWTAHTALGLAKGAHAVTRYEEGDTGYVTLPLFHANGLFVSLLPALLVGAHTVVDERFSARTFWPRVREVRATVTSLLGIMAPLLMSAEPVSGDRDHVLRRALVVPAPVQRAEFEARFGTAVQTFYALSDVGMPVGVLSGDTFPDGACGRELPDWECRLVDRHDRPVGRGEAGELVVRPRAPWIAASGYRGDPAATVAAWRNLWFHTGDLMTRDDDGWYYFRDRTKDAIRRSGENVSSFEVESVIETHSGVAESAVFAVASDLAEDEVMAVVVPGRAGLTADEVAAHCRRRLPHFAVPRYVELVAELPRTASQKIRKADLRRRGITALTVDVGRTTRRGDVVRAPAVPTGTRERDS